MEPSPGRPSAPALPTTQRPSRPLPGPRTSGSRPAPAPTVPAGGAPGHAPPGYKPGLDPSSLGLPPRVTRPGVSVRGLQVMSPRKCRAGVGLTPNPDPLHPAHRPLDRASVGRGGKGGWHQADGRGPPTKGKGEREAFPQTISLNSQCLFSEMYHHFIKKKKILGPK